MLLVTIIFLVLIQGFTSIITKIVTTTILFLLLTLL